MRTCALFLTQVTREAQQFHDVLETITRFGTSKYFVLWHSLGSVSYQLFVAPDSVPPGLIAPSPVGVSVVNGAVTVNTVPGVTFVSNVLTITVNSASGSVSGTVLDTNGNPYSVLVKALDSADNPIGSVFSSPANGTYSIPLAPGVYEIALGPFSLPPGFTAPASQTVNLFESPTATANFTLQGTVLTLTDRATQNVCRRKQYAQHCQSHDHPTQSF